MVPRSVTRLLLAWLLIAITAPVRAAPPPDDPIAARSAGLLAYARAGTDRSAVALFAPSFLAQVPAGQVRALFDRLKAAHGPILSIDRAAPRGPHAATLLIRFRSAAAEADLAIEPAPPHRITGLLIRGATARLATLAEVAAAFAALPGSAGLSITPLGTGAPPIAAHAADRPLAIGSAFKLVILAALVRDIEAGERRWTDVAPLDRRSLGSGILQRWPDGAPMTLHSLAALMIATSDNGAADTLLALIGRERVEAMQAEIGLAAAARNRPFLSTIEAFKLKGVDGGRHAADYAAADEAGRRALLAGPIAALPIDAIDMAAFTGTPQRIDSIEWFASPADLVRVLDWLRRHGERPAGAPARAILAIDPGVARGAAGAWRYLGYKGGSEPGVIAMAHLAETPDGRWFAIAGAWNDPARPVDEDRFRALVARAIALAGSAGR